MRKMIHIFSLSIFCACGAHRPPIYECSVGGYANCRSEYPDREGRVQKAAALARAMLIEAGVTTAEEHDRQIKGFDLYIHAVEDWVDLLGRPVSGEQSAGLVEVGQDLSALLHEEIHMLHSGNVFNWQHPSWERLGYYGLDTFFDNTLNDYAWNCEPNRGMTIDMVDSLRRHGRPIDEFLNIHPECLNEEPK